MPKPGHPRRVAELVDPLRNCAPRLYTLIVLCGRQRGDPFGQKRVRARSMLLQHLKGARPEFPVGYHAFGRPIAAGRPGRNIV